MIIDVAVPGDFREIEKQQRRLKSTRTLVLEVKMWKTRTKVIPAVIGSLGGKRV